jgi:sugar O-acyltransferase (sialic acid O-acetyltransferase NeuD family)
MKKLVVFGTGSFSRVARFYFSHDSAYQVAALTVHEAFIEPTESDGLPLVPFESVEQRYPPEEFDMFVAIGFKQLNKARAAVYRAAKDKGYHMASYLSSKALYFGEVNYGDNCFLLEGNVIQPFTRIGDNVILWSGNHIGHDVVIESHCFLSSHIVLSGRVRVGEYSFIGVNACTKPGVTIGAGSLIGSGAIILKDTKPGGVHLVNSTPASPVSAEQIADLL